MNQESDHSLTFSSLSTPPLKHNDSVNIHKPKHLKNLKNKKNSQSAKNNNKKVKEGKNKHKEEYASDETAPLDTKMQMWRKTFEHNTPAEHTFDEVEDGFVTEPLGNDKNINTNAISKNKMSLLSVELIEKADASLKDLEKFRKHFTFVLGKDNDDSLLVTEIVKDEKRDKDRRKNSALRQYCKNKKNAPEEKLCIEKNSKNSIEKKIKEMEDYFR